MSVGAEDITYWLTQWRNGDNESAACQYLLEIGPADSEAVAPLMKALEQCDETTAWMIAKLLGQIGPAAMPACNALIDCLSVENDEVRKHAALALGFVGCQDSRTIDRLNNLLPDPCPFVQVAAASSLLLLDPPALAAIDLLEKTVSSRNGIVLRYWAACGIADAASCHESFLKSAISLLGDWDHGIRDYAAYKISKCSPDEAMPKLLDALHTENGALQDGVLMTINKFEEGQVDPFAPEITSAILGLGLLDGKPHASALTVQAIHVVGRFSKGNAAVAAKLKQLAESYDKWVANDADDILNAEF